MTTTHTKAPEGAGYRNGAGMKPLGRKAYGSIPHLPGSRMGPADHHCHDGQRVILTEKARDKHDRIIVTEKLDGGCVSVARVGGELLAVIRAGYLASTSPFRHLQYFADWVRENSWRFDALKEGDRLVGEWLSQAHGTRYDLYHEPFVPFDLMSGEKRRPTDEMSALCTETGLRPAALIHDGGPITVDEVLSLMGEFGHHGAVDPVEGAVWRCERKGEFDFIAKFVRHDKIDGKFLPEISGCEAHWHWTPEGGESAAQAAADDRALIIASNSTREETASEGEIDHV